MEIRTTSKSGPLVPSPADVNASLSQQTGPMKQRWLDRLARDPADFAQVEVEIHDHFRRLADQMTASLLAAVTLAQDQAKPGKRGAPAASIDRDAHHSGGG